MKNLFLPFALLMSLVACNNKQPVTSIRGMADNVKDAMFVLGGPGGVRDSIKLDESNNFSFEMPDLTEPGNYYILSGKGFFTFYIAPDMQLDIYFDQGNFLESLNFAGVGSDINNYLADKARTFGTRFDYEVYKKDPDNFKNWADSVFSAEKSLLDEQVRDDPSDPFWDREEADILYGWAGWYSSYPGTHKYYADGEDVELPDGFDSYKEKLDLNRPEYLKSRAYASYISTAVMEAVTEKMSVTDGDKPKDKINKNIMKLETAVDMLSNAEVLNNYLYTTVTGRMQYHDLSEIQDEIDFFMANCKDETTIAKFNSEYEIWKRLSEGQPAIEFAGKDLEGNTVKLSDFKGKYVYVDVWATWCGPCKYEIPYLKTLEADYHGKNIVFISYSIDEDHPAWLKFVPEKELGGVQIIGEDGWTSKLCLDYKIHGVPTFMFFDPEGKIISVKMTRPSNQKTRDSFDSYSDL